MIAERLRLQGIEDLGTTLAALVARLAAAAELGPSKSYRLRLAAEEIVTNIATHGYGGERGVIDIDVGLDDTWAWLRLEDQAPEFDPAEHDPTPRLTADPHMAPLGGFGLFLALSSVDRLEHSYADGRNRNVLMVRRRPGSDGGADGQATGTGGG